MMLPQDIAQVVVMRINGAENVEEASERDDRNHDAKEPASHRSNETKLTYRWRRRALFSFNPS
jgi:hypothetical protein